MDRENKPNILLIYLPDTRKQKGNESSFCVPLGALVIAEHMKACLKVRVDFHDLNERLWRKCRETGMTASEINSSKCFALIENDLENIEWPKYAAVLLSKDFYDFAVIDASNALGQQIIGYIKCRTSAPVILGGSRLKRPIAERIISLNPSPDYCFYNETWSRRNETDIVALLSRLFAKGQIPPGFFWSTNRGIPVDHWQGPMPITSSPLHNYLPSMDLLDVSRYQHSCDEIFGKSRSGGSPVLGAVLPVKFMDGCINRCGYCDGSLVKPYQIEPEKVVEYLEYAVSLGISAFYFLNRQLNMGPVYLTRFCEEIIRKRLQIIWTDSLNLEQLKPSDIPLLKPSGCIRVCAGLETISPTVRRRVRGKLDLGNLVRKLDLLNKEGIWVMANLIVGMPYETDEDVTETIRFMQDTRGLVQRWYIFRFQMYEASPMVAWPEKFGLEIARQKHEARAGDLSFSTLSFAYSEKDGRSWKELQAFADRAYQRVSEARDSIEMRNWMDNFPLLRALYVTCGNRVDVAAVMRETVKKCIR